LQQKGDILHAKNNTIANGNRILQKNDKSMLQTFFEKEIPPYGTQTDNTLYFQGKKL